MSSFARRLGVTMAVPVALYFLGEHLVLPGIPRDLAMSMSGSHAQLGALALGITPVLTAYCLVEVVAFLVPRWSRLRHGNPEGRAKLDLVARILALVLATVQAFGVARTLQALAAGESVFALQDLGEGEPAISVPLVVLSLVGGVCVQFVAARFVSQRGLVNGFVLLLGAGQLHHFMAGGARDLGFPASARPLGGGLVAMMRGPTTPRDLAIALVVALVLGVATWIVLGTPSEPPLAAPAGEAAAGGAAPYRTARRLVVRPWIPVPASSLQAYVVAASLLMLPHLLLALGVPVSGLAGVLETSAFVPILGLVTAVVVAVFARLMHRPAEMADLALRLGAEAREEMQEQTRVALRSALPPSLLFLLVVVLAGSTSRVDVLLVPLLVALGIDLARAIRIERARGDLVPVWEERRASAVPVLRAALAADGIASETHGMAVLSLWQLFAPYAPAEILVKKEDEERATRTLLHVLLGENRPEPAPASPEASPLVAGAKDPWPLARRTRALALCAMLVGLVTVLVR